MIPSLWDSQGPLIQKNISTFQGHERVHYVGGEWGKVHYSDVGVRESPLFKWLSKVEKTLFTWGSSRSWCWGPCFSWSSSFKIIPLSFTFYGHSSQALRFSKVILFKNTFSFFKEKPIIQMGEWGKIHYADGGVRESPLFRWGELWESRLCRWGSSGKSIIHMELWLSPLYIYMYCS